MLDAWESADMAISAHRVRASGPLTDRTPCQDDHGVRRRERLSDPIARGFNEKASFH
jgi:hypothetical protein